MVVGHRAQDWNVSAGSLSGCDRTPALCLECPLTSQGHPKQRGGMSRHRRALAQSGITPQFSPGSCSSLCALPQLHHCVCAWQHLSSGPKQMKGSCFWASLHAANGWTWPSLGAKSSPRAAQERIYTVQGPGTRPQCPPRCHIAPELGHDKPWLSPWPTVLGKTKSNHENRKKKKRCFIEVFLIIPAHYKPLCLVRCLFLWNFCWKWDYFRWFSPPGDQEQFGRAWSTCMTTADSPTWIFIPKLWFPPGWDCCQHRSVLVVLCVLSQSCPLPDSPAGVCSWSWIWTAFSAAAGPEAKLGWYFKKSLTIPFFPHPNMQFHKTPIYRGEANPAFPPVSTAFLSPDL